MRLEGIGLTRFKAFEHGRLSPAPLTILIGPNNAGKSTVLHALALLAQTASGDGSIPRTDGPIVDLGSDPTQLIHDTSRSRSRIGWTLDLEWNATSSEAVPTRPVIAVEPRAQIEYRPADPQLHVDLETKILFPSGRSITVLAPEAKPGSVITAIQSNGHTDEQRVGSWPFRNYSTWSREPEFQPQPHSPHLRAALELPADIADLNLLVPYAIEVATSFLGRHIHGAIEAYRYVTPNRHVESSVFPLGSAPSPNPRTARDLVDTLAYDDQLLKTVSERSHQVLGYHIDIALIPDRQVSLMVVPNKGRPHNIVNAGAGLVQLVWILTQLELAKLSHRDNPQLAIPVGLEEPELHLHPAALPDVARVLATFANDGVQILATTQSERLLLSVLTLILEGTLKAESVAVHYVDEGAVTSLPVDDRGQITGGLRGFFEANEQQLERYIELLKRRV